LRRRELDDAARAVLALLQPSIEAARAEDGWRDISTAPRDGEDILATDIRIEGGFPQVVYWDIDGNSGWCQTDARIVYHPDFFTHWRRDCLAPPAAIRKG
jgi:hypothetical protein